MTKSTAYLGIGSNLQDRQEYLRRAVALLQEVVVVEALSSVYETAPWGYLEQPAFLNGTCRVRTELSPGDLLRKLQGIEVALGRRRQQHWGPRTIDLDILLYDDLVLQTAALTLPHPLLHERAFVLVPLAEIAPQLKHPRLGKTIAQLLDEVEGREQVRLWAPGTALLPNPVGGKTLPKPPDSTHRG